MVEVPEPQTNFQCLGQTDGILAKGGSQSFVDHEHDLVLMVLLDLHVFMKEDIGLFAFCLLVLLTEDILPVLLVTVVRQEVEKCSRIGYDHEILPADIPALTFDKDIGGSV